MCFARGPSAAEKQKAAEDRLAAEQAKEEELRKRAEAKREDIAEAISGQSVEAGKRGGRGRRSMFRSFGGTSGFLGRYG